MDKGTLEERCFGANKRYGQLVGVWPDQGAFTKYLARTVTTLFVVFSIVTQVARVVKFYSFEIMTDQLPFLLLAIGIITKQYNYIFNAKKLRKLLNGILDEWSTERPKEELDILEAYARQTAYFSLIYRVTFYVCLSMYIILPAVPPVLDIVSPMNESRARILLFPAYYFVPDEDYYYFILGHMIISAIILVCVFIACDLNLVCFVRHAGAVLAISSYRFKHAIGEVRVQDKNADDECYRNITRSIDAHKTAIEYINDVEACHVHGFFITIGLVIMSFAVTLVKLTTMDMCMEYFAFAVYSTGQLVHLTFLTIMGQFVIDSNEEVHQTIRKTYWYNSSVRTQSLYVLVLRKCLTPPKITGGGLIEFNLNSFVQILKASFSYYTVIKS